MSRVLTTVKTLSQRMLALVRDYSTRALARKAF
jgi:hypothetical protein